MQCDHPNLDPLLTVRELYNPLYSTFSSSQYVRQSHPLRPIQPNRLLFFLSTKTIVGLSTDSQLQSPLAWTRCIYSISKLLYPSHFFSFLYIPSSSYEVPLRSHLSSGTLLKSLTYLRNPMLSLPSLLFSSLLVPCPSPMLPSDLPIHPPLLSIYLSPTTHIAPVQAGFCKGSKYEYASPLILAHHISLALLQKLPRYASKTESIMVMPYQVSIMAMTGIPTCPTPTRPWHTFPGLSSLLT